MASEVNFKAIESRRRRILHYLQSGHTINPKTADTLFGEKKLATRISELILKDHHTEIKKRWIQVFTLDDGEVVETRVKEYYIDETLFE